MSNTSLLGSYGGQAGDGLLFRNRIVNGCMRIDQRNAGASVANANGYIVDRFAAGYYGAATGRFTAQQSAIAPTGFTNSLSFTVTTAQASLASGDGFNILQRIEGFNAADLVFGNTAASSATVSFWVRSSQTGTFGVMLGNSALDRVFGALVTVNSANTFEYKTVTIQGDTTGTWLTNNGIGLQLFFGLGGGAGRTVSVGWSSGLGGGTPCAVTGQTLNICAANGATFYITGVQLEAGPVSTPFERRPIGVETQLCMRYYQRFNAGNNALLNSTYQSPTTCESGLIPYIVPMRDPNNVTMVALTSGITLQTYLGATIGTVTSVDIISSTKGGSAFRVQATGTNLNTAQASFILLGSNTIQLNNEL